ncbi:hypothetical protein UA08_06574 [Talaromyces atroroseus]|uniref:Ribosome biogenesis protein Alb1 n=1 Tax=Talaromyces atroroseus TaxID=1441469 RepID=A0A225AM66_TALAT|nr:hypothetical protein UA08_06574 [Talaromyces atroroseus]OKL58338.1 hypothetical protein UA08_06574 [Talaromyces atroroseus]
MGRTGKLKKKATSVHSRAARRGASPSDVNKSLESVPRMEAPTKPSSILAAHTSAGISKKKSKAKPLSRAQRLRQQKGIERAEMVIDQLETKVAKSIGKAKAINARRAQWEDLNSKNDKTKAIQQGQESDDEQMKEIEKPVSAAPKSSSKIALPVSAENNVPSAGYEAVDEDDNIT